MIGESERVVLTAAEEDVQTVRDIMEIVKALTESNKQLILDLAYSLYNEHNLELDDDSLHQDYLIKY